DETAGIYPSDNVAAVVEVKSVLDKGKLREAHENIFAAKGLVKTAPAIDAPGLVHTRTLGCVFAFESPLKLETLAMHLREFTAEAGLGQHIDYVAVLDRGVLSLACSFPGQTAFTPLQFSGAGGPLTEGAHFAVASY